MVPSDQAAGNKPDYEGVLAAFDNWGEYTRNTATLVNLTYEGLNSVVVNPDILEQLTGPSEGIENSRKNALDARREIDADFPTVHAHHFIGMWGALEAMIEDVFVGMVKAEPGLLINGRFENYKLPVSVMASPGDEKYSAILAEVSRATKADLSKGIGQFEKILTPIGMDGGVDDAVRDAVFYGQQVRNLWAHRAGVVDQRFALSCPHLGLEIGDKVNISSAMYRYLATGLTAYSVTVLDRFKLRIDLEPTRIHPAIRDLGKADFAELVRASRCT